MSASPTGPRVELTEKELFDLLAQRMLGAFRDPDAFADDATRLRDEAFNEGVECARRFVAAARDDKFCPHCGYPEHRSADGYRGVSLRAFAQRHGTKGSRMLR